MKLEVKKCRFKTSGRLVYMLFVNEKPYKAFESELSALTYMNEMNDFPIRRSFIESLSESFWIRKEECFNLIYAVITD